MDCSTLKPGDICITRDGREVEFIGSRSHLTSTSINGNNNTYVFCWRDIPYLVGKDGLYRHSKCCDENDIIRKKPEKKVFEQWINIYTGEENWSDYNTRKEADDAAAPARIACIHIKQEYVEGEGL